MARGHQALHTIKECPRCGGTDLVCRPVLDETITIDEPRPGLWWDWRCCDRCRLAWLDCAILDSFDDNSPGVMDSERHYAALFDYEIWDRIPRAEGA